MSKKTGSQMEALLMEQIEKAKEKLEKLQQKHKLDIGTLAYKHNLHLLNLEELDLAFAKLGHEVNHDS